MEQRLTMVTLGVADLDVARAFYTRTLGWQAFGPEADIAFFHLGAMILGLYPHDALAEDMALAPRSVDPAAYPGHALAYNTRSEAEVDQVLADIEAKGGTILKPAHKAFWGGYSGYFADPDGHAWEVAFNPHWPMNEQGHPVPQA